MWTKDKHAEFCGWVIIASLMAVVVGIIFGIAPPLWQHRAQIAEGLLGLPTWQYLFFGGLIVFLLTLIIGKLVEPTLPR